MGTATVTADTVEQRPGAGAGGERETAARVRAATIQTPALRRSAPPIWAGAEPVVKPTATTGGAAMVRSVPAVAQPGVTPDRRPRRSGRRAGRRRSRRSGNGRRSAPRSARRCPPAPGPSLTRPATWRPPSGRPGSPAGPERRDRRRACATSRTKAATARLTATEQPGQCQHAGPTAPVGEQAGRDAQTAAPRARPCRPAAAPPATKPTTMTTSAAAAERRRGSVPRHRSPQPGRSPPTPPSRGRCLAGRRPPGDRRLCHGAPLAVGGRRS